MAADFTTEGTEEEGGGLKGSKLKVEREEKPRLIFRNRGSGTTRPHVRATRLAACLPGAMTFQKLLFQCVRDEETSGL
jgi:hypothetical protein